MTFSDLAGMPVDLVPLRVQYEAVAATDTDIKTHLPKFVEWARDAEKIIELGTRTGVSTVAWLYGLEGHGHLWSVDIDPKPPIGTYDHWTFIQGDDCSADVYLALPDDVDAVFIDTSHAYLHTLRELNLYRWKVKPGGLILLHDTELARPFDLPGERPYPVKRAVTEFCAAEGLEWENHTDSWGLGIIRL